MSELEKMLAEMSTCVLQVGKHEDMSVTVQPKSKVISAIRKAGGSDFLKSLKHLENKEIGQCFSYGDKLFCDVLAKEQSYLICIPVNCTLEKAEKELKGIINIKESGKINNISVMLKEFKRMKPLMEKSGYLSLEND